MASSDVVAERSMGRMEAVPCRGEWLDGVQSNVVTLPELWAVALAESLKGQCC
jgi:hypothetical protein